MSDLFGNHIAGFPTRRLSFYFHFILRFQVSGLRLRNQSTGVSINWCFNQLGYQHQLAYQSIGVSVNWRINQRGYQHNWRINQLAYQSTGVSISGVLINWRIDQLAYQSTGVSINWRIDQLAYQSTGVSINWHSNINGITQQKLMQFKDSLETRHQTSVTTEQKLVQYKDLLEASLHFQET